MAMIATACIDGGIAICNRKMRYLEIDTVEQRASECRRLRSPAPICPAPPRGWHFATALPACPTSAVSLADQLARRSHATSLPQLPGGDRRHRHRLPGEDRHDVRQGAWQRAPRFLPSAAVRVFVAVRCRFVFRRRRCLLCQSQLTDALRSQCDGQTRDSVTWDETKISVKNLAEQSACSMASRQTVGAAAAGLVALSLLLGC